MIGFGFTSDWMKKRREFFKPIMKCGDAENQLLLNIQYAMELSSIQWN